MRSIAYIAPTNSLVLVMDRSVGVIPANMSGVLIAATPSCVAVGTLSEHDGITQITLADEPVQTAADQLVFDGVLETPSRHLAVCTVLDEAILETAVEGKLTRVRIWANDGTEPSDIRILVSAQDRAFNGPGPDHAS